MLEDLKKRNFNIIQKRLSGLSVVNIAEEYSLTTSSIHGIIKTQLSKIADYDYEFERRLGELVKSNKDNDAHATSLSEKLRVIDGRERDLKVLLTALENENTDLKDRIKYLVTTQSEKNKELGRDRESIDHIKKENSDLEYKQIRKAFTRD